MYSIFHVEILCLYFNVSGYLFLVKVKYFWELHIFIILCGSKYLNVLALPLADEVVCVRRKRYGCLPDFIYGGNNCQTRAGFEIKKDEVLIKINING